MRRPFEASLEEQRRLGEFAESAYPGHFGASVVIALTQTDGVADMASDGRVSRVVNAIRQGVEPAVALASEGWQLPIYDSGFIASLALERWPEIDSGSVEILRKLTRSDQTPAAEALARLANKQSDVMLARVNLYARAPACERVVQTWTPSGVQALWEWRTSPRLLRDASVWISDALANGWSTTWTTSDVDAALSMVDVQLRRQRRSTDFPALDCQRLQQLAQELLPRASMNQLAAWVSFPGEQSHQLRRVALALVTRDVAPSAAIAEAGLVYALKRLPERKPVPAFREGAGVLQIFDESAVGAPAPELMALLKHAEASALAKRCVEALCAAKHAGAIAQLVSADHALVYEEALAQRFARETDPAIQLNLARALCLLGTPTALATVAARIGAAASGATICEQALAETPGAGEYLVQLSRSDSPRTALAAARALSAGRHGPGRERLEALALTGEAAVRWTAIDALGRAGRSSRACAVLRESARRCTHQELALIVEQLARCAVGMEDVRWALDLPLPDGLEGSYAGLWAWNVRFGLAASDGKIAPEESAWENLLRGLAAFDANALRSAYWADTYSILIDIDSVLPSELRAHAQLRTALDSLAERYGLTGMASSASGDDDQPLEDGAVARDASFSVIAPKYVALDTSFILEVFIHSKDQTTAVLELSRHRRHASRNTVGPKSVRTRSSVRVDVELDGFALREASGEMVWDGDLGALSFRCTAPSEATQTEYLGCARFSIDGVPLAVSDFSVRVGPVTGARADTTIRRQTWQSAFASYASEDRPAVLARLQGIQKVAPHLDIFLDVVSLRSGQHWQEEVMAAIAARDVLLLFWSCRASMSEHVTYEWRTALRERGLEGIEPVPLESPTRAPPPAELSALHFNDWTLVFAGA